MKSINVAVKEDSSIPISMTYRFQLCVKFTCYYCMERAVLFSETKYRKLMLISKSLINRNISHRIKNVLERKIT